MVAIKTRTLIIAIIKKPKYFFLNILFSEAVFLYSPETSAYFLILIYYLKNAEKK